MIQARHKKEITMDRSSSKVKNPPSSSAAYKFNGRASMVMVLLGAVIYFFYLISLDPKNRVSSIVSRVPVPIFLGKGRIRNHNAQVIAPVSAEEIVFGRETKKEPATQVVLGLQLPGYPPPELQVKYVRDLAEIDFDAVERDIEHLLTDSKDWWPADYGNYGGLFIRLSWHSCGSYRNTDGRGGCDGGGQRFDPERSWADNTNLDKARSLLEPIKSKYGNGLSWGDLFALSGTVAIKSMGGPDPGFCAGRMDFVDNSQTIALGPSEAQEKFAHCEVNGQCSSPLGTNTLGLIYVNPEGPMGEPDLEGAAASVREVFGRMDWEGRELVALIGGGHTFGKSHGASTASNGDPPNKCPFAPWDGPVGVDAITSGFEGSWTSQPTQWDNNYFKFLVDYEWEPAEGPGGHWQWRVKGGHGPKAPVANPHSNDLQDVMMLTTDVSLVKDPEYRVYVEEFATDETAFKEAFGKAWYKLVTRDMGPVTRCGGRKPPKAQDFQHPLPSLPRNLASPKDVEQDLKDLMKKHPEGEYIRLAYQCASTFRATDYQGGCNGARIRFPPGNEWPINKGLERTLKLLEPIKRKYGPRLSFADLIVLAGNVAAVVMTGSPPLNFCPGRTDAEDGSGWDQIAYGISEHPQSIEEIIELYERRGQTARDFVALTFVTFGGSSRKLRDILETKIVDQGLLIKGLQFYPELRYWAEHYVSAGDEEYGNDFSAAWTRLMNADRFDGPVGNLCT